ncbi:hypothetical protein P7K49_030147, partial [Saguinus oedipus]
MYRTVRSHPGQRVSGALHSKETKPGRPNGAPEHQLTAPAMTPPLTIQFDVELT